MAQFQIVPVLVLHRRIIRQEQLSLIRLRQVFTEDANDQAIVVIVVVVRDDGRLVLDLGLLLVFLGRTAARLLLLS